LTVQSLDSNTSYAIEELLPIGISPFNIQSNGVWIKEKSSVRWGAYKDNEDRNLNCSITGLPGIYEIQSEVSANGKTDLIPGKSNIIIPSAFKTLNRKIENNKCI